MSVNRRGRRAGRGPAVAVCRYRERFSAAGTHRLAINTPGIRGRIAVTHYEIFVIEICLCCNPKYVRPWTMTPRELTQLTKLGQVTSSEGHCSALVPASEANECYLWPAIQKISGPAWARSGINPDGLSREEIISMVRRWRRKV